MKYRLFFSFLFLIVSAHGLVLHAQSETETSSLKVDTIRGVREDRFIDNVFFGVHLGFNGPYGENIRVYRTSEYIKSNRLGGMLSVGKFFTPIFGLRGTLGFMRQTGRAEKEPREVYPEYYGDGFYEFSNFHGYADVLVDMHNWIYKYREDRRFHIIPMIGVGFNTTFGFDKEKARRFAEPPAPYLINTASDIYFALRAGVIFSYHLSKVWDLDLEIHMDATDDKYNGVIDDRIYDGYLVTLLGFKYNFRRGHEKYRLEMTDALDVARMNANINQARQDLAAAKAAPVDTTYRVRQEQLLEMTVSFIIDKFNITDVQRPNVEAVAAYIKSHPDVDIVICGYADVQTAYPAYNMRLSKRRVMAVYNMLTQQFGVDPKRLSIDYKGDTEQPYLMENPWNRVVVFKLTPHNEYKEIK
ncbi:MAG: OmpA family protein [Prevotella sp.]|nr:OmpA family protein [Prevotella sp.]